MQPSSDNPENGENSLLALCRPGFESDCAAELSDLATSHGWLGYARAPAGSAHARFVFAESETLPQQLPETIFARRLTRVFAHCTELPADDRIGPMLDVLVRQARTWCQLVVEAPDSDQGRELSALCRSLGKAFAARLRQDGLLCANAPMRLHLCLLAGDQALLGEADDRQSAPCPGGIPRLRKLAGAPSRSAGKLEEAFAVLLDDEQRQRLLQPGMHAVDLGAAPGGWSWVLARRHLRVAAIDNGPLAQQVLDSGVVEHIRADGFTWRPPRPVDWLVCDMVEQPARVAELIGRWLHQGWCRQALFNLKLPMKQRYAETRRCLALLREGAGRALTVRCRHLYHDREEVTVLALGR